MRMGLITSRHQCKMWCWLKYGECYSPSWWLAIGVNNQVKTCDLGKCHESNLGSCFPSTPPGHVGWTSTRKHDAPPPSTLPPKSGVFTPKPRVFNQKQGIYTNCYVFIPTNRLPTKRLEKGMFFSWFIYISPINDLTGKLPYHNADASANANPASSLLTTKLDQCINHQKRPKKRRRRFLGHR